MRRGLVVATFVVAAWAAPIASSRGDAPAPVASASASSSAAPVLTGSVVELGMHLGGEPNDAASKERVRRSTRPLFPAFEACWARRGPSARAGHVGVDLRVPGAGGRAILSHERASIGDDAVVACVLGVLREAEFQPVGHDLVASYSLRFTP